MIWERNTTLPDRVSPLLPHSVSPRPSLRWTKETNRQRKELFSLQIRYVSCVNSSTPIFGSDKLETFKTIFSSLSLSFYAIFFLRFQWMSEYLEADLICRVKVDFKICSNFNLRQLLNVSISTIFCLLKQEYFETILAIRVLI